MVIASSVNRGEWLNPLNRITWQKAFKEHADSVTLDLHVARIFQSHPNGKRPIKFNIHYRKIRGVEKIWVHPAGGQGTVVPCGWFDYKTCVDPLWVTDGQGK